MRQHQHSSSSVGLRDWVSHSLRDRPEAFLLMAAGVALMMTNTRIGLADRFIDQRRSSAGDWRSREHSVTQRVSDSVDDLREAAGDYTERARHYVQETGEQITRQSGEMMDRARSSLQENVTWMVQERPLVLGALSFAAGALLGTLLPETEVENRTLGTARDELTEAAGKMAQERVDALKSAAGDVSEPVSKAVSGGGTSSDEKSNTARSTTRS